MPSKQGKIITTSIYLIKVLNIVEFFHTLPQKFYNFYNSNFLHIFITLYLLDIYGFCNDFGTLLA